MKVKFHKLMSVVLDDKASLIDERLAFHRHVKRYEPVLEELLEKSTQKIGKKHLTFWLDDKPC